MEGSIHHTCLIVMTFVALFSQRKFSMIVITSGQSFPIEYFRSDLKYSVSESWRMRYDLKGKEVSNKTEQSLAELFVYLQLAIYMYKNCMM